MTTSVGSWDPPAGGGGRRDYSDWIECPEGTYRGRIIRAADCGWHKPYMDEAGRDAEHVSFLFVEVDEDLPEGQGEGRYVLAEEVRIDLHYGPLRSIYEAAIPPEELERIKDELTLEHLNDRDLMIRWQKLTYAKDDFSPQRRWKAGDPKIDKRTGKQKLGITAWFSLAKGMQPLSGPFKEVDVEGKPLYGLANWKRNHAEELIRREGERWWVNWNERAQKIRNHEWEEKRKAEAAKKRELSSPQSYGDLSAEHGEVDDIPY